MSEKDNQPQPNLLDLRPRHAVRWQRTADDRIELLTPRVKNTFLRKFIEPRLKKPDFHIALDEYGSWVWQQIDGEKTVLQIGELLERRFGDPIQPVYERLGQYINQLARHRFILLDDPPLS